MRVARLWVTVLIAIWIAGTVIMAVVATQNFRTIDRLHHPAFRAAVVRLGDAQSRELLRYLSSELNRLYFRLWNAAQPVIGAVALWLVARLPGPAKARWGVIAMLGLTLMATVWLLPQIVSLGRALDFVPRDPRPPELGRFWVLHGAYLALDVAKLIVGAFVIISLQRASRFQDPH